MPKLQHMAKCIDVVVFLFLVSCFMPMELHVVQGKCSCPALWSRRQDKNQEASYYMKFDMSSEQRTYQGRHLGQALLPMWVIICPHTSYDH